MPKLITTVASSAAAALTFAAGMAVGGCASYSKLEDFADRTPKLVLEDYFVGQTQAHGVFEDRFNRVRRTFTVDITGTLEGDTLTLDEQFLFDDGETDQRIWVIKNLGNGQYRGHVDGEISEAFGQTSGNAFNWNYKVPLGDNDTIVTFNDWMFLMTDDVLLNRAYVSKWGVRLGEVTISFAKTRPSD